MELITRVLIAGQDQSPLLANRILGLTIEEHANKALDTLELVINNYDAAIFPPTTNAKLELALGFSDVVKMGEYLVQEVEYNHGTITLKAIAQDLTKVRIKRSQVFTGQTLSDVLEVLANNLELTLECDADLKAQKIPYLLQNKQSDLSLLQDLGELFYANAKIANNKLIFISKKAQQTPININQEEIISLERQETPHKYYQGVKASYWHAKTATIKEVKEGQEPFLHVTKSYAPELLKFLVSAKFQEIHESQVITITTIGTPNLQAGLSFSITENSNYPDFAGNYKITKTKHHFDGKFYTTKITAFKIIQPASKK